MSMFLAHPIAVIFALFVALMLCLEAGRWLGRLHLLGGDGELSGAGTLDGAVFALLGLLLAFSLSGAATRFDGRRTMIVDEANAIGTAFLRVDLVQPDLQPPLRRAFKAYIDARILAYRDADDEALFQARLARSIVLQQDVWRQAIAAGKRPDALPALNMLLLPALNEMIDISATRTFARLIHPPATLYALMFALTAFGTLLAGYGGAGRRRDWVRSGAFALAMAMALLVTIDLEFPRMGFLRVDSFEAAVIAASKAP